MFRLSDEVDMIMDGGWVS